MDLLGIALKAAQQHFLGVKSKVRCSTQLQFEQNCQRLKKNLFGAALFPYWLFKVTITSGSHHTVATTATSSLISSEPSFVA